MKIGVLCETSPETRVSLTPKSTKRLIKAGCQIRIEAGAGDSSGFPDEAYLASGALISSREEVLACEVITSVGFPEGEALQKGQTLVCIADPFRYPERLISCRDHAATLLSLDLIPRRLSRAQAMDVNSSQDNLAGYKAVLLGAAHCPKALPMMTTSAGTIRPARAVVMGSGVAGLQAIATARRLGAIVYASDVRLAAKEQIESVGGRFIEVEGMEDFEDASGYAKPLTPEFIATVNAKVNEVAAQADLIITTARLFGRPAPITIPITALSAYKTGAVIVDMNADVGGNCEGTVPGQVVTHEGVTIVGTEVLPRTLPQTASTLYSNNLTTLLLSILKDGQLHLAEDDAILTGPPEGDPLHVPGMGGVLVCQNGELHPAHASLAKKVSS